LENIQEHYSAGELGAAAHALREAVVGNPEQVKEGISAFIRRTGVNEIMFSSHIFEHQKRLRSIQIAAQCCRLLAKAA
jgi:alkanesulfonate monooxygenase SsuD/methylene tetrahydromethanopterin reductase-like flavin-dependent oxidoreductase (luciferase family)